MNYIYCITNLINNKKKPHIILEFSKRHDESIYFDSDEEMEGWLESFRQEFGKPFIYIE